MRICAIAVTFVCLLGSRAGAGSPAVKLVPQVFRGAGSGRLAADGRHAVRWLDGNRLSIWDHESGIFLGELEPPAGIRVDCAISPDGRYLAFDAIKEILVQDLDTGKLRRIGPLAGELTGVWFSRDGSRLFATHAKHRGRATSDHAVSAWSFATGAKLSEVRTASTVFSPRHFALGAMPDELYWPQSDEIQRHDMATGKLAERIPVPVELRAWAADAIALAVSADGKRAVTRHVRAIGPKRDVVMAYWDWPQRKVTRTVQLLAPKPSWIDPSDDQLAISPDGSHVVVRTPRTNIRLYRFGETTPVKEVTDQHDLLGFTGDSKRVVIGTGLRNVTTGELVMPETPKLPSYDNLVAMHGTVAFAARDHVVTAWDLAKLERRWVRTEGVAGQPTALTVSPDGAKLTVVSDRRVRTIDSATGALLSDEATKSWTPHPDGNAYSVDSPDGKWMVTPLDGSRTAELRALATGALVRKYQLAKQPFVERVMWTRHGFVSTTRGTLQFWTVASDQPVATHVLDELPGQRDPMGLHVAISPDGNTVAVARGADTLRLFDAATGAEVRKLSIAGLGYAWRLAITDDRRWAVLVVDGTPMALDLARAASVRLIDDGVEWVIADADGVFTASAGGGRLLAAVRGRRGFLIDQLALRNNDPAKLMRALGVGSDEQRAYYDHVYRARLRKAGVDEAGVADMFESIPEVRFGSVKQDADHADIELDLEAPRGLLRYNIDVNGVPVFGARGKPVSGPRQRVTERIRLGRGKNRIELRVVDTAGIEGFRPVRILETASTGSSELYFLGFGVSSYANPAYKLEFARKDALDLAAALQDARSAFQRVHTRVYIDEQVTPDHIRAAKEFVARAGVDDVVVVMIAGHGIHSSDGSAKYYFVTHGTDIERLAETAAPFEDIEDLLDGIASRRKLFLMDTCESGERDPDEEAMTVARAGSRGLTARTARALKQVKVGKPPVPRRFVLERDNFLFNGILRRSGAVVFSSSRGSELSYETGELRNGVFTQAVLDALTGAATDVDGDGRITIVELRARVARHVSEYTGGAQNPTIERDNLAADLAFPVLTGARAITERASAPLADYVVAASSPVAPVPPATPSVRSRRGCGCETGGAESGTLVLLVFACAYAVAGRRRFP